MKKIIIMTSFITTTCYGDLRNSRAGEISEDVKKDKIVQNKKMGRNN